MRSNIQTVFHNHHQVYILASSGDITDEDSEEDTLTINNLPNSQLLAEAEYSEDESTDDSLEKQLDNFVKNSEEVRCVYGNVYSDSDSEDNLPLSVFARKPHKKKKTKCFWEDNEVSDDFPKWQPAQSVDENLSPVELFNRFMDKEFIAIVVNHSNKYAFCKNLPGDISPEEMLCTYWNSCS
ncbi:hypothetical protein ILUMI_12900 [Ignelater luminosus]|uniref:PiggyBac transposable element-derived protein domain-containing protein n=1 Tax=Ignelater luminosus TaxID=2038154 RepID=A0A8K0CZH6_IGNLU|nr:hypothetical protein ILUMI_12900 [Ignelater luminosus]